MKTKRTPVLIRAITKGDKATVPDNMWVAIKNLEPLKSKNNEFSYGDRCVIQRGGTVKVVGIDGDHVLVRYSIKGPQFGASCPSGALFFITKTEFSEMTARYHQVQKREEGGKTLIRRLTEK